MQSPDKPKRRMVVYVTEETYANLQELAKAENRSVSNVAEGKIISGLCAGPDRTGSDLTEAAPTRQDRAGPDPEELKTSVIDVLDNLPADSLTHLAEKLARILDRSVPVLPGQNQTVPEQTGSTSEILQESKPISISNEIERKKQITINVATRLSEFVQKNHISQRKFRQKYGVDITSLRFWLTGQQGMSLEMIEKMENILSSDSASL